MEIEMQQTDATEVADMLFAIKGVVEARAHPGDVSDTWGRWPKVSGDGSVESGHEWRRGLVRAAIDDVFAVAYENPRGSKALRIECDGYVVVAQVWDGHTIAVMAKMGTPHTKSLARAIRNVRRKVEQPKPIASTA